MIFYFEFFKAELIIPKYYTVINDLLLFESANGNSTIYILAVVSNGIFYCIDSKRADCHLPHFDRIKQSIGLNLRYQNHIQFKK